MMVLWSLISSADTLVGKYGSDSFKKAWDAEWIAPKWGWKVWIIGLLIITVVFMFEFTFRESSKRETGLRQQLDEEKSKNQRPEYIGRIYEAFIGPAAYWHNALLPDKKLIVVDPDASILVLNVGIINMRDVGNPQVGTTISAYRLIVQIDDTSYIGKRQCNARELQTLLLRMGPAPSDVRIALNLEGDNFGSVFYLHERRGYVPFYVDGLKCEPEKNQRCKYNPHAG